MKYGKEITEELVKYLKQGATQQDAANLAGISEETFYAWKRSKLEFSEAIKRAEAECKQRNITLIQKAAITTWQAAAWWLERRFQNEYSIKYNLNHTGNVGVNFSGLIKQAEEERNINRNGFHSNGKHK